MCCKQRDTEKFLLSWVKNDVGSCCRCAFEWGIENKSFAVHYARVRKASDFSHFQSLQDHPRLKVFLFLFSFQNLSYSSEVCSEVTNSASVYEFSNRLDSSNKRSVRKLIRKLLWRMIVKNTGTSRWNSNEREFIFHAIAKIFSKCIFTYFQASHSSLFPRKATMAHLRNNIIGVAFSLSISQVFLILKLNSEHASVSKNVTFSFIASAPSSRHHATCVTSTCSEFYCKSN